MLTDTALKSQVDRLWDMFWTGGLTNPLDAIEQFSYLLFLKRLDEREQQQQKQAALRGRPYTPQLDADLCWDTWTRLPADKALKHLKEVIFPKMRLLGAAGSSFEQQMQTAECKINKPNLLIEATRVIEAMRIGQQQQDVQGDLYEYLLGHLNTAGRNGQFRTPRHIIRLMVQMIAPQPMERMGDLAAGTAGFLVNMYQYILEQHTSPDILQYDAEGWPHHLIGDLLSDAERAFLQTDALRGYDNDSGMTMLRIGSMNLMLHGIDSPRFFYADTLSKEYDEPNAYDVILMNPPFKGAVDKNSIHPMLPQETRKSELLFLHRILRALDMGGRCAVIVPDGVLFGSSGAHVEIRRKLVEEHGLWGVVSMPSGVFKPYAGVSTAVLIFAKGSTTDNIWFYDMAHDGFSLDDKRNKVAENDIPDLLACWQQRHDPAFAQARAARLAALKAQREPLLAERLRLEGEINRLTFESVISPSPNPSQREGSLAAGVLASPPSGEIREGAKAEMEQLQAAIAPLQAEIAQLRRQFWVSKKQVKANKYDLSASRYREIEPEPAYYERPQVTLKRLLTLEQVMENEVRELESLLE